MPDPKEATLRVERDAAERAVADARRVLSEAQRQYAAARKRYAAALDRLVTYRDSEQAGVQKQ